MPTKADASRARLLRFNQTAFGSLPGANAVTTRERLVSESLHHKNTNAESDEIRADLQRTDQILMGYDVDGDIVEEVTYGNQGWMWEAALGGAWTAKPNVFTNATTTASSPTVTHPTAGFTSDDLHKAISGGSIPANSYIGVVNSATSIGLSSSATANTPVNATASASNVTITIAARGDTLINGTALPYFTFERGYMDLDKYIQFVDCAINTLDLDVTSRRILRMTAGIMGGKAIASAVSMAGSTTPTEPTSRGPIGAGPLIQLFDAGGTAIQLDDLETKEVKFRVNRNLRIRDVATDYKSGAFGMGAMELTGSLNAYFSGIAEYNGFIANSQFSLRWTVQDPLDVQRTYRWTLPFLKVQDLNPAIGGIDTDVMMPIPFRAFLDPTVGYAVFMERGINV